MVSQQGDVLVNGIPMTPVETLQKRVSTDLFLTAPKKLQGSKTTENYKNIKMEAK